MMALGRAPFRSKSLALPPRREAPQWTGSTLPTPRTPAANVGLLAAATEHTTLRLPIPKTPERKSQAIRDSARGEECSVRIIGACNFDPATTVWSHGPWLDADRGMGIKGLDLAGALTCAACHDVIDGRRPLPPGASRVSVEMDWHRGHLRSLVRLRQKGLV